jgi:hypothetical protein
MFFSEERCFISAGVALLGLVGAAHLATAGTIYSDSLAENSNSTGTQLAGQTVQSSATYAGGTQGAAWGTNTSVVLESGIARTPYSSSGGSQIYLPFSAQSGYIYTLTITLNDISGNKTGKGWAGVGFAASDASYNNNFGKVNEATAFVTVRTSGSTAGTSGEPAFYPGQNSASPFSGGVSFGTSTDNGQQTVQITLNTVGLNTAQSPWTAQATLLSGSDSSSSVVDLPAGTSINYVGFGNSFDQSDFSNFSLSAVSQPSVPEPAPFALMALAGIGLTLLRRRA